MAIRKLIIFLIFISGFIYAQNSVLIGTWQVQDTLIAAGMGDTYRFYNDGRFNFDFGSFNYNARFINVSGTYFIQGKYMTFEVDRTVESKGGEISFGDDESDYNSWTIVNDKYTVTKLNKKKLFRVTYKLSDNKKKLTIAGLQYFKISNDPAAERDKHRFPQ